MTMQVTSATQMRINQLWLTFLLDTSLCESMKEMTIKTNNLRKGDMCYLRNGWKCEIYDNMKGNTRLAKVYGYETEIGSVYSHDIVRVLRDGVMVLIEHTPAQKKLMATVRGMGM